MKFEETDGGGCGVTHHAGLALKGALNVGSTILGLSSGKSAAAPRQCYDRPWKGQPSDGRTRADRRRPRGVGRAALHPDRQPKRRRRASNLVMRERLNADRRIINTTGQRPVAETDPASEGRSKHLVHTTRPGRRVGGPCPVRSNTNAFRNHTPLPTFRTMTS